MILHVVITTPIGELIENLKGSVTILDIKVIEGSKCKVLVEVTDLTKDNSLKNIFTQVSKNKFMGSITLSSKLMEIMSKYTIIRGDVIGDVIRWSIILSDYEELKKLLRELSENGYSVRVLKVLKLSKRELLTPKQERILLIALEAGYFDYPRKIGLRRLAKELNLSPSSLSEIIRRAERKIILNYFRVKG